MKTDSSNRLFQRVLVTGASGFVGTHLVRRLARSGCIVAGLARSDQPSSLASLPNCSWIQCDLTEAARTIESVARFAPQAIVHLAALPDSGEDLVQAHRAVQNNLLATVNLLEAARQVGTGTFLYGDSTKAFGNGAVPHRAGDAERPTSSYGVAKVAGWQFCLMYRRLYGLSVLSLRPTLVYGPGQRRNLISVIVEAALSGQAELELSGGNQTRDPLYISDAIDAYMAALPRAESLAGEVICLGGGKERSVAQIADIAFSALGASTRIKLAPTRARPTEIWRSYCDNAEARAALDWSPRVDMASGIRATAAAHRRAMHA